MFDKNLIHQFLSGKQSDIATDVCMDLYQRRCVNCSRVAHHVHEIIPRSHGGDVFHWTNRVPLCYVCHDTVHRKGGASQYKNVLRLKAVERLVKLYASGESDETTSEAIKRSFQTWG